MDITLTDMMLPVILIYLAYLTGYVGSIHIQKKQNSGKPYCLWYYTFGYGLIPLGLSMLAILNVIGVTGIIYAALSVSL